MQTTTELNKEIILRFNSEVVEQGNLDVFHELVSPEVINHAAPAGAPNGIGSMVHFIWEILRPGFPDIQGEIHDMIAEGDKVTTRKTFHGTHTGLFMGVPPTQKKVAIHVIDIIRLKDGKIVEHWAASNIPEVLGGLAQ